MAAYSGPPPSLSLSVEKRRETLVCIHTLHFHRSFPLVPAPFPRLQQPVRQKHVRIHHCPQERGTASVSKRQSRSRHPFARISGRFFSAFPVSLFPFPFSHGRFAGRVSSLKSQVSAPTSGQTHVPPTHRKKCVLKNGKEPTHSLPLISTLSPLHQSATARQDTLATAATTTPTASRAQLGTTARQTATTAPSFVPRATFAPRRAGFLALAP